MAGWGGYFGSYGGPELFHEKVTVIEQSGFDQSTKLQTFQTQKLDNEGSKFYPYLSFTS
jgi:hypothetical protein